MYVLFCFNSSYALCSLDHWCVHNWFWPRPKPVSDSSEMKWDEYAVITWKAIPSYPSNCPNFLNLERYPHPSSFPSGPWTCFFGPSGSTPSWTLVVRSSTTSTWCGAPTPIHWHPDSRPFVMSKSLEKVLFLDVFGNASSLPLSNSVVWSNNESDHVWSVFYSQVGTLAQDCDSKLPFMSVHCVPGFGGRIIHNHTQT